MSDPEIERINGCEVTHREAVIGGLRLHYVDAGSGDSEWPPIVLLHGFPEFWYGWRSQIPALVAAGFRVIALDLRGYNCSAKPPRVSDYRVQSLVDDVLGLIDHLGGRAHLVGHDWGGVIAWHAAMRAGTTIDRVVILNAPHPAAYLREVRRPAQLLRSWYAFFFQFPWLPEAIIRFNDFRSLRRMFRADPANREAFSEGDVARHVEAFSKPHALESAINYYRAAFRQGPTRLSNQIKQLDRPVLLIWGERDRYLVPELTEGLEPWVPDLRIERLPDATHWVQHDDPEHVNQLLIDHLMGRARTVGGRRSYGSHSGASGIVRPGSIDGLS